MDKKVIISIVLALILIIGFYILVNKKSKVSLISEKYTGQDIFTYDVLYADSPKNQVTDKGNITYNDFLNVVNSFPWDDQMRLANKMEIQSPTLSVHDQKLRQTLFISMSGNPDDSAMGVGYIVGITKYTGENSKDSVDFAQTQDKTKVLTLIEKLFTRNSDLETFLKSIK